MRPPTPRPESRCSRAYPPYWGGSSHPIVSSCSDRWWGDPEDSEVEVELGAVVKFVLLDVIEDPVQRVLPLVTVRKFARHHACQL